MHNITREEVDQQIKDMLKRVLNVINKYPGDFSSAVKYVLNDHDLEAPYRLVLGELTNLPDDLRQIGYPEGAKDYILYSSIFFSPSTERWYGILDNDCFAIGDSANHIADIMTGDIPKCFCWTLFYSKQELDRHDGIHGIHNSPKSTYVPKKRLLTKEEAWANIWKLKMEDIYQKEL